jgi:hypothetical protein
MNQRQTEERCVRGVTGADPFRACFGCLVGRLLSANRRMMRYDYLRGLSILRSDFQKQ